MLRIVFWIIISVVPVAGLYAGEVKDELWDSGDNPRYHFENLSEKDKAMVLEKYRTELEYCIKNLGKPFSELDADKIGKNAFTFYKDGGYVTYALIAYKYSQYEYWDKSAKYYYKDYQQDIGCAQKPMKSGAGTDSVCTSGGPMGYPVLPQVIEALEWNNDYKSALRFYQMWYENWASQFNGTTLKEKKRDLKRQAEEMKGHTLGDQYDDLMEMWARAKKLAKTTKPKQLDPAVQNHEWFYSVKWEEVLRALKYYYVYKVSFMLEKALKHKDPVIAAKAKVYLLKLSEADKK